MNQRAIDALSSIAFADATDFTVAGAPMCKNALYKGSSKLKALEPLIRATGGFDPSAGDEPVKIIDDL